MKRTVCFLLLFAFLLSGAAMAEPAGDVGAGIGAMSAQPLKDGEISISAPSAVLMEKETGQLLYEKNAHERMLPASVTKVMTLLLITEDIESGRLKTDDIVTASARAASFGGSCVYLEEGEQMSVDEMLKCIAVVSANDCAVAMAEHVSGTEEIFVQRMNERAAELGLEDTHFTNCTGLFEDTEHYTSAYDIAVMSRELIRHELIKKYTTIWMDSIRGGQFGLNNTNKLVYWYPGCTGLKTGFTSNAMYCLSATAERDGTEFIAVIMHGDSIESRNQDAKTLLNYAFANFALCSLRPEGEAQRVPVQFGRQESVAAVPEGGGCALIRKSGTAPEYSYELLQSVPAPVTVGDKLGIMTVSIAGETVAQVQLVAAENVGRIGCGGILLALWERILGFCP